jgi:hypothetical protein
MCCLFGLIDSRNQFGAKEKSRILSVLATECEERGTDATGIAYCSHRHLSIYKRPIAAHRMRFRIPADSRVIMGHTRMTTQGDARKNRNNHPFLGYVENKPFALAHNGVLWNDGILRRTKHLPKTKIQTDSYVAVQLLEQQKALDFDSLAKMAEQDEGSFSFAVLDEQDALWIVKGDSPLSIAYFPECGVYVYASTAEILNRALTRYGRQLGCRKTVEVEMGELLKIDRRGHITRATFDASKLCRPSWEYWSSSLYAEPPKMESEHIRLLKSVARAFGFTGEMIDRLLDQGFTTDDIEEILYEGTW